MKVFRIALPIVAALAVAVGVAAWTCPADLGYRFAGDALAPLRLRDLGGSIWNGHAAHADLFGTDLGAVAWQLQAVPLLRGTIAAHVTLSGPASASGSGIRCRIPASAAPKPGLAWRRWSKAAARPGSP